MFDIPTFPMFYLCNVVGVPYLYCLSYLTWTKITIMCHHFNSFFDRFFEYKTVSVVLETLSGDNVTVYTALPTSVRLHPTYSKVKWKNLNIEDLFFYFFLLFLFLFSLLPPQISTVCSLTLLHLVPLVCLAYLNCAIYSIIR